MVQLWGESGRLWQTDVAVPPRLSPASQSLGFLSLARLAPSMPGVRVPEAKSSLVLI